MKLTFLGTGDAFGTDGRMQTCILAETVTANFLIDCGTTAMIAMRKYGVVPNDIQAIFLSHLHGDHFGGVPFFIIDAQFISRRETPLTIVGPSGTRERIISAMEVLYPGLWNSDRNFDIKFEELQPGKEQCFCGIWLEAFTMEHPSGSISTGLKFKVDGKQVSFTGDTGWNDYIRILAQGADLFIAEAYSYNTKLSNHLDYITLAKYIPDFNVKRVVLTHLGPEAITHLTNIQYETASDGLVIEI